MITSEENYYVTIDILQENITGLWAELAAKDREIQSLRETGVYSLSAQVKDLQTELHRKGEIITELYDELHYSEGVVSRELENNWNLAKEIRQLREDIAELERNAKVVESEYEELEAECEKLRSRITDTREGIIEYVQKTSQTYDKNLIYIKELEQVVGNQGREINHYKELLEEDQDLTQKLEDQTFKADQAIRDEEETYANLVELQKTVAAIQAEPHTEQVSHILSLQADAEDKDVVIDNLTSKVQWMSSEISQLLSLSNARLFEIDRLRSAIDNLIEETTEENV